MARLMLLGETADILLSHNEDGVLAECVLHKYSFSGCGWSEQFDDLSDATEYASDHADKSA